MRKVKLLTFKRVPSETRAGFYDKVIDKVEEAFFHGVFQEGNETEMEILAVVEMNSRLIGVALDRVEFVDEPHKTNNTT